MLKTKIFAIILFALSLIQSCTPVPALAALKSHRHSWEPEKKVKLSRDIEKLKPMSTQEWKDHWAKVDTKEANKIKELTKQGWIWIHIPKILILIPVILILIFAAFFSIQPEDLEWVKIRVIRETQKGLCVEGAAHDFWVPKSVIRKIKVCNSSFEILIPVKYLP